MKRENWDLKSKSSFNLIQLFLSSFYDDHQRVIFKKLKISIIKWWKGPRFRVTTPLGLMGETVKGSVDWIQSEVENFQTQHTFCLVSATSQLKTCRKLDKLDTQEARHASLGQSLWQGGLGLNFIFISNVTDAEPGLMVEWAFWLHFLRIFLSSWP